MQVVFVIGFSVAQNGLEDLMGGGGGGTLQFHVLEYNHGFHSSLPLVWSTPVS